MSQLISLFAPIAPILDSFLCLGVHCYPHQLSERNRQWSPRLSNLYEHLVLAVLLRRHALDLDLIADFKGRGRAKRYRLGGKGEVEVILQVDIPTCSLLLRFVAVYDDLHLDTLLALLVATRPRHVVSSARLLAHTLSLSAVDARALPRVQHVATRIQRAGSAPLCAPAVVAPAGAR